MVHPITWTSSGSPGAYVKIELMKAGVLNQVISSSTQNDGYFGAWSISSTQTLGTDYKIRITSTSNSAITDSSNSNFAITAGALTVTAPNGGQTWARSSVHSITWTSTGSPGANVKIELLKGGVVNRVISSSTANDGSYSWTVPSTQTVGSDYKIRITSTSITSITDSSNSNFAIS
jgi:5-hydroxyisourate hydrolase-like protein (transthyretin family)